MSQSTATNLTGSSESLNKGEKNSHMLTLSELGNLVLRDDSLGQCLTLTLLRALNWPDSHSSARASALLELIMPSLASSEQISSADVEQVMFAILQALHTMGMYFFFTFYVVPEIKCLGYCFAEKRRQKEKFSLNPEYLLKFRLSEKDTKFEKNLPLKI